MVDINFYHVIWSRIFCRIFSKVEKRTCLSKYYYSKSKKNIIMNKRKKGYQRKVSIIVEKIYPLNETIDNDEEYLNYMEEGCPEKKFHFHRVKIYTRRNCSNGEKYSKALIREKSATLYTLVSCL